MEAYIQITQINDYTFCPKSLYFSGIFRDFDRKIFNEKPQVVGSIAHEKIDEGKYSTSKHVLQGSYVYSDKYQLCGKIDTFDIENGELVERKYQVKKIYDGFRYQLYAQMLCLEEMGYEVKKIAIYSKADNKKYRLKMPSEAQAVKFKSLLKEIHNFNILDQREFADPIKCANCIYKPLCH